MPIESHIDSDGGLIFHTAEGLLVAEELLSAFDSVASDPVFRPTMGALWDLTGASIEAAGTDDVKTLAAAIGERLTESEYHKVAIAAPHDLTFGLARMYEAYTAQLPIELGVFRTRDEALEWLEGEDRS
jgi:hypothetical protein